MATLIDCPACQRKLRVPDDFLGKSVRCPTCGETFTAPEPPAVPAPAPTAAGPAPVSDVPLKLELDDAPAAPAPRRADEKTSPRRREPEPDEDEDDDRPRRRRAREEEDDEPPRRRRDAEPHRGGTVQGLGIASLVLAAFYVFPVGIPLGIAAWAMGRRDLRKMAEGVMDPAGRKKTKDGWLCGLIGTLINCLWAFGCVGFVGLIAFYGSTFSPPPPPAPVGGPVWKGGPAQANNFTLSGPPGVVRVKRGIKQPFAVILNRGPGFQDNVTVSVDQEPDGLEVTPPVHVVPPGGSQRVTFDVTADANADAGDQVVRLRATDNGGGEVILEVRVRVQP